MNTLKSGGLRIKRINIGKRRASRRLLRACCRFGIGVTHGEAARGKASDERLLSLLGLERGQIALVGGPSGCGKSTLLQELRALLRARGERVVSVQALSIYRWDAAAVDLLPVGLERSLRLLALVGLADAMVLGRSYRELSVGERARLDLARAFARAGEKSWILADEFLTTLDRATAAAIARGIRYGVAAAGRVRFVAATAHEDVGKWLGADVELEMGRAADLQSSRCDGKLQSSKAANRKKADGE